MDQLFSEGRGCAGEDEKIFTRSKISILPLCIEELGQIQPSFGGAEQVFGSLQSAPGPAEEKYEMEKGRWKIFHWKWKGGQGIENCHKTN